MFTLSTKSDYGLLLLTILEKKKTDNYSSISKISKETKLPYSYISRIAAELSTAGFLKSKEGSSGGYKLSKKPEDIKIGKVIEILEGPFSPTKCSASDKECKYEKICPMCGCWQVELKGKMWEVLKDFSLKDLMKRRKKN